MSRLIEEEFDELVVYVAGLKKTFSRKLDDHLFIIQQQNERLDEQARLIDEIAWQIRDLRASVRSVDEKLKVEQQQRVERDRNLKQEKCKNCDYANVMVVGRNGKGGSSGGSGGVGVSLQRMPSIRRPRITIINEEVSDGVAITHEEEYHLDNDGDEDDGVAQNRHRQSGHSSWEGDGIYEPIQFTERRDYTAPRSPTSLSAKHRQKVKEDTERDTDSRNNQRTGPVFHFPPPPPLPFVVQEPQDDIQEVPLRPTKDYQAIRRMITSGGSNLAIVNESSEEAENQETVGNAGEFLRGSRSAAEREANSIKRRAYILPSNN